MGLGLQEEAYAAARATAEDRATVAGSASTTNQSRIAPPLTASDTGRRGGDLPYWRVDPRWLRSYLPIINARAKHLVRNNRHAATAARDLPTDIVGTGIHPTLPDPAAVTWRRWSTRRRRIHVSRRLAWMGLQWLICRSVMVTGEAFIVMRRLRASAMRTNGVPFRLEIFDADGVSEAPAGGMPRDSTFDQGRERGPAGHDRAWHFRIAATPADRIVRIPASDVVHVYDPDDCASERGISWFSPVVIDLNELRGYQDSTAVKQHLASKITLMTTDATPELPAGSKHAEGEPIEDLEPGAEIYIPIGRDVKPFEAPLVREYRDYVKVNRSEIAVCLGTTPEALSGDYSGMSWTVARASYRNHWERLRGFRRRWLQPAVEEVYDWASWVMGREWPESDELEWQLPVMAMLDPDKEGLANLRQVRAGFKSLYGVLRDYGHDPVRHLAEVKEGLDHLHALGIVLDSDSSMMTAQGQAQPAITEDEPGAGTE